MFPNSKIVKSERFTAPSRTNSWKFNSKNKFNADLRESEHDLCNQRFDSAQNLLNKNTRSFKQTKLGIRHRSGPDDINNLNNGFDNGPSTSKRYAPTEFFLMPLPCANNAINKDALLDAINQKQNGSERENEKTSSSNNSDHPSSNPMKKMERDKLVIMGKVDFCFKMHKLYPNFNIMWDVYGKIVKILSGKNRGENILILRSPDGLGPVIPCVYYDFENILVGFPPGTFLRAVGQFMNENRLRTFFIELVDGDNNENEFSRIQNILRGKNRGGNILILRSHNGLGPVIPSVYYNFENILSPDTLLRAVGEIMNENQFFHNTTSQLSKITEI